MVSAVHHHVRGLLLQLLEVCSQLALRLLAPRVDLSKHPLRVALCLPHGRVGGVSQSLLLCENFCTRRKRISGQVREGHDSTSKDIPAFIAASFALASALSTFAAAPLLRPHGC